MRMTGEKPLSSIPPSTASKAAKNVGRQWVMSACETCGEEQWAKEGYLRKVDRNPLWSVTCSGCRQKGKAEMNAALIALARRKGLIA